MDMNPRNVLVLALVFFLASLGLFYGTLAPQDFNCQNADCGLYTQYTDAFTKVGQVCITICENPGTHIFYAANPAYVIFVYLAIIAFLLGIFLYLRKRS